MAIVKKFSIGIQPFAKMFRVIGRGGEAVDAVLRQRGKALPESYFTEVGVGPDRKSFHLTTKDLSSTLHIAEDNIALVKDYYESAQHYDFKKVLDEFRVIWTAVQSVLKVEDIRRIGIVAEHRYVPSTPQTDPSIWLRDKLLKIDSNLITDKFRLRFEEREFAADGKSPDLKKSDFINFIYDYYDSDLDDSHPVKGRFNVNVDVQRYFAPLNNGNIHDELLKLHRHFEKSQKRLHEQVTAFGATHEKK